MEMSGGFQDISESSTDDVERCPSERMPLSAVSSDALDLIEAQLASFDSAALAPSSSSAAVALIEQLESIGSRVDALRTDLVVAIDRTGVHAEDGHANAKVMVRHVGRLRGDEAAGRAKAAKAMVDLPQLAAEYRHGELSTCVMRKIAQVHANRRVRRALIEQEDVFVSKARTCAYPEFERWVNNWVRRTDEDGTCDRSVRTHANRDARLVQDFEQAWSLSGGFGALQGAELDDIFRHFIDAEFRTDWAKALLEHGDDTHLALLERTDSQRRADALARIFEVAASSATATDRRCAVTNVKIDHATYERWIHKLAGADAGPIDVHDPNYVCETIDGALLEPGEVVAQSLVGHIRRVVVGADSVTIDLGRKQRLFVGGAREAVQLADSECLWPGCRVRCSSCQIDHSDPWSSRTAGSGCRGGGSTCPGNGGPLCGRHNRLKELRFETRRDSTGTWRTYRPDGTKIE